MSERQATRVRTHRDLEVWEEAYRLALTVYQASSGWPEEERYGLAAQARRAGVSVAANIAEGAARRGAKEFRRGVDVARGSLAELDTYLRLAADLGYAERRQMEELLSKADSIGKMLTNLARSLSGEGEGG